MSDEAKTPIAPIHFPRPHFGRFICGYCSLDMPLPVHPVEWPCQVARDQGIKAVTNVGAIKQALLGVYENRSSMCRDDWGNEAETIDGWYQEAIEKAFGGSE